MSETRNLVDLFVIGGGINGCGIARDAAGRGYTVALAEMNDLASATSSASTKLFHGGLRYLEFLEFRLVREALIERETLLRAMPHISWPMRFILPYDASMRFDSETPVSRFLARIMPWMKGRRPAWLLRLALLLYDTLGGRKILPGTSRLNLQTDPEGAPLKPVLKQAFEYSDCWVEDARLVVLNARDAAVRGAKINVRSKVVAAHFADGLWHVQLQTQDGSQQTLSAKMLVNAGGPWVETVINGALRLNSCGKVRLVRGSHIVTRKLFDHEKSYFFQGKDGRIMFAIPYEEDFTLIGTTDADHSDPGQKPECSAEEQAYLLNSVNQYFAADVTAEDVVWRYAGVRPLYDDGASSATAATRDYVLRVDCSAGGPVLNVFGGKITTYRRLAESALELVDAEFGRARAKWTAGVALPGGDFPVDGVAQLRHELAEDLPFLQASTIRRLIRQYGSEAQQIFAEADSAEALGNDFGSGIYQRELDWAIAQEWVHEADDFLWRRSKLGLRVSADQRQAIEGYIAAVLSAKARVA